eukprot:1149367-Rhodomonas_salina.3
MGLRMRDGEAKKRAFDEILLKVDSGNLKKTVTVRYQYIRIVQYKNAFKASLQRSHVQTNLNAGRNLSRAVD